MKVGLGWLVAFLLLTALVFAGAEGAGVATIGAGLT
jgi:hypothetical protein